eukprot:TRINITY_DN92165_c0_g1_i1.p1 TRINITY_DN92165_c0_g1~~TRINITY_DN92165_c0_g1_i1.p1  ORF type:complete len:422 (-),score=81.45 TRINITY_DN92165_c0_g1_i1:145-1377(-)
MLLGRTQNPRSWIDTQNLPFLVESKHAETHDNSDQKRYGGLKASTLVERDNVLDEQGRWHERSNSYKFDVQDSTAGCPPDSLSDPLLDSLQELPYGVSSKQIVDALGEAKSAEALKHTSKHFNFPLSQRFLDVALSLDGSLIAAACGDYCVRVFSTSVKREQAKLDHEAKVFSVAFNPQTTKLVSGCRDGYVRVFDLESHAMEMAFAHDGTAWCLAFNMQGTELASATHSLLVHVWSFERKQQLAVFPHKGIVRNVTFNKAGTQLATASRDGKAHLFDLRVWSERARFSHPGMVIVVAFNDQGSKLATGCIDRMVRIFNLGVREKKPEMCFSHDNIVTSLFFNSAGTKIASSSRDGVLQIRRLQDNQVESVHARGNAVAVLNFSGEKDEGLHFYFVGVCSRDKVLCKHPI